MRAKGLIRNLDEFDAANGPPARQRRARPGPARARRRRPPSGSPSVTALGPTEFTGYEDGEITAEPWCW